VNNKIPVLFFSRRFYFFIFLLAGLAFQIGSFAQSSSLNLAVNPDLACPPIAMCIRDPETGHCMGVACPTATSTPAQRIEPICLPGEPIDMCTDPFNSGECWRLQPCIAPQPAGTPAPQGAVPLVISEFRFRGPGGPSDEFVELFNMSASPVTVSVTDGSAGWALVASDGIVRFTVPAGTVIPGYGHYLGVNSQGYSLGGYPAGNGTTASGDAVYLSDIPDRAGIALFNTANPANFTLANRVDAAGYSQAPALYREGSGFPDDAAEVLFNIQYSFFRDLQSGSPQDTNDNVADFKGVDTNGTNTGGGQRLGAPGPENLSGPVLSGSSKIRVDLLDPAMPREEAPNRVRDTTPDTANNSRYGTLSIRRTFVNVSNQPITRLRVRVVDITGYPYVAGTSDVRAINSTSTVVTRSDGSNVLVRGTTLETPPAQINGGGWNSTLSSNDVTLSTPIYPNQGISLQFLLGVQQSGYFRFFIVVETLQ
jgi:hypothetical protein